MKIFELKAILQFLSQTQVNIDNDIQCRFLALNNFFLVYTRFGGADGYSFSMPQKLDTTTKGCYQAIANFYGPPRSFGTIFAILSAHTILFDNYNNNQKVTTPAQLHDALYKVVHICKVHEIIADFSKLFNVAPWQIGVYSDSKVVIAGDVLCTAEDKEQIADFSIAPFGNVVPVCNYDKLQFHAKRKKVKNLQIIDHHCTLLEYLQSDLWEFNKVNTVCVTTKGIPSLAARRILFLLCKHLKVEHAYLITNGDKGEFFVYIFFF